MPRHARIDLPGYPRHICIRGIDGMACFTSDMDRHVFLKYLREAMEGVDFSLHAFVLMSNHVHLLATGHTAGAVPKVMHHVGLQYARYFNQHFDRCGPLFQGRYWASLIGSQGHFFNAMRYVELNPVRARLVDLPQQYPWSSHAPNTGRKGWLDVTPHDEILGLGGTPAERFAAWADFVSQGIDSQELERLRNRFRKSRPYGSDEFERRISSWRDGSVEPSHGPVP